jgi:hypothetical protein
MVQLIGDITSPRCEVIKGHAVYGEWGA